MAAQSMEEDTARAAAGDGSDLTYPWPPVFGGAPVSPSPMARLVVAKVLVEVRREGRASLVKVVRSMLGRFGGIYWRGSGGRGWYINVAPVGEWLRHFNW
jgi:hypothetical protein